MPIAYVVASRNPAAGELEKDVHSVEVAAEAPAALVERIALDVVLAAVPELDAPDLYLRIIDADGRTLRDQNRDRDVSEIVDTAASGTYAGIVDAQDLPFRHDHVGEAAAPGL